MSAEAQLAMKHKIEMKALRNEIQALKKSVPKGDRKKKKEVDSLIAERESEVKKKHQEEIQSLPKKQETPAEIETNLEDDMDNLYIPPDDEEEVNSQDQHQQKQQQQQQQPKKSKAQRRKEKKEKEEEEMRKQIEDECKGLVNYKEIEEKALRPQLLEIKKRVYEIPADGNCLYSSVAHQLRTLNLQPLGKPETVTSLRQLTANEIKENKTEYMPFMSTADGDMLTDAGFEVYCNKVASTSEWGGQLEIRALAHGLRTRIQVYQANSPPVITGDFDDKIYLAYFRRAYGLGEHYNSLIPTDI